MRTICAARVAVATLGGCGDDDTGPATVQPEGQADLVTAYEVAYDVCVGVAAGDVTPDPAIEADPDTDPVGWATEFASDYEPPFQDVYYDGCLDAFDGRPMNPPG